MKSRLSELAARREALVAESRALRAEIRGTTESIHARLAWVEKVVAAGQALHRSGPILAGVAIALVVVGPGRLIRLLASAYRYGPTMLGAYQFARRAMGVYQERSRE